MGTDTTELYNRQGYAYVPQAASGLVVRKLLGVIQRDMTANPATLRKMLSTPRINAKPAYEFYSYRYPAVFGFHWGLTSRMADLTGKELVPTYAFFRVYQKGDICTVHSDRESCEHSFSMALGYADNIVWPFEIGEQGYEFEEARAIPAAEGFEGAPSRELMLNPGDAVLYQGCGYRHGRTMPNPNRWSAHLFLHWVDANGPFKSFAFDRQKMPDPGDFPFPG